MSSTFHGRDIFAPVAGHLAAGTSPTQLGPALTQMTVLNWPDPVIELDEMRGEVLCVDSFGNIITNLSAAKIKGWAGPAGAVTELHGRKLTGIQTTYGKHPSGEIIALSDSYGRLEVAQVNGNASNTTGAKVGDIVRVTRKPKS